MEAPIPMDNKPKTLPPYGGMMPPLNHHPPQLHGPPPGFQRTPPPPPPHDGQPHGLPAPIPHTSAYEQPWRQPYPPSHYEAAAQRRHSNPVAQAPPPQSQPPPPGPPPSHPHAPYPPPGQHPSAQPQGRELPQLPPGDPYHRPNSLPAPAPPHPVSEPHSPRTYRPMNGTQPEPIPHSAPPPGDYRTARIPYTGPGEPPPPGVTNGDHAGPPPGYMQHVGPHGQPPPGAMYDGAVPPYPRQRKAARAQQACDQCRARKAKCDEGRPACSHCRENNIECKYKDIPPQKQEKSTQLVLDGVRQSDDNQRERFDTLMERFIGLEQLVKYFITQSKIPLPPEEKMKPAKEKATSPNGLLESKPSTPVAPQGPQGGLNSSLPATSSSQSDVRGITGYLKTVQHAQSQPLVKDEDREVDGELAVPQNHKTAAHKLLDWPSIKRLLDRNIDTDYVLRNERRRGLIRLYGCGEGCDHDTENHWRQNRPYPGGSPATDSATPQSDEEYSRANSPSWGYGLPMPPQSRLGQHYGGIDPSGYLNAHPDVVRRLLHSYMSNMHILHPIMNKNTLPQKVERFIQQYGQYHGNIGNIQNEARGMKRKRSAESMHPEAIDMSRSPSFGSEKWSSRRIEHSIENAVILLVLALGAICEHKGPLPGFPPDPNERHRDKPSFASSPEVQSVLNEILTPPSGPVSGMNSRYYQSPGVQSPDPVWEWKTPNQRPNSRLGPEGMVEASTLKNIDVIPGLAYYAYAAGILGEMQGGCELPFVQAAILASFYAGQLAHPFQSHGWICQAARACSFLTRKDEYAAMQPSTLKELYEFAYWTCLQHESDLLAELDFTASGVSQSETRVSLPTGTFTMDQPLPMSDDQTRVMFFYSAQIHLRKVLNRVHRDLYDTDVKKLPDKILTVLGLNLDVWKSSLPEQMQWNEEDEPSEDINTARLRAKYYGARYIIYRPVLELALHSKSPKAAEGKGKLENDSKPSVSSFKAHDFQAHNMARWSSEPGMRQDLRDKSDIADTLKFDELDDDTRRACQQCITAAIQSTKAFHNIKGRPIVTNIFGTAHAQFGNMLVLSATYMSNLSELVNAKDLEYLLQRTIKFLAMYKDISPTLMADAQILSGIYYKIFKKPLQTSFTTESFGST
ncbi:C6 finger domain protein, putative [Talaromyces stipitatus ATCC 10500]|uniref:C6 finger domain protein, putative n=1 Tax=Talaromyces stipitatus (strain ATCC 10500 / CBS 375.48 / QM 6759 / NRRL 1006) TaxID=441959 RepID=B8M1D2_TALSN|nr:C6 finger domain protein, putative [Talaromyces stipitatus ATCC 10500]EED21828.1 C6 finger domain protein, putative [Talaromyces stipitatus ATCC 10500]